MQGEDPLKIDGGHFDGNPEARPAQAKSSRGVQAGGDCCVLRAGRLGRRNCNGYLKDILSRLPTQPNSRIGELLPHRWLPEISA